MSLFKILSENQIELKLSIANNSTNNFSENSDFIFPELYKKWIKNGKTVEVFPDFVLYNYVEATNETKDFVTNNYWVFAENAQGDRWLMDKKGAVFFYNHDYDEGFDAMELNFLQSLQMAFLFKQLDEIRDEKGNVSQINLHSFLEVLNQIHPNLSDNYPFIIE